MDQSSFHCSWLALGAQSEGCFPSRLPHMCHVLSFSVSPAGAGLCSCQQAAFEVHLPQVGTKTASNQCRFRFQAILFDHAERLRRFQDHADAHELMQNWQKLHFTWPQLKASLPLKDLWGGYCNVNLGMVETGWYTPTRRDTKLSRYETVVHRIKQFGHFPHWVGSCLKQKPTTLKISTPFLGALWI